MSAETEFSAKEVAIHRGKEDAWMVINGEVYDLTKYLEEHPGGADILVEAAGTDATDAFDNAGHSEDAFEIMADFRVGKLKGAGRASASKPVRVTLKTQPTAVKNAGSTSTAVGGAVVSLGALAGAALGLRKMDLSSLFTFLKIKQIDAPRSGGFGFVEGFAIASALAVLAGGVALKKFSALLNAEAGALHYAPHKKIPRVARADPLLQRGFLDPLAFHPLPLIEKEVIAPNVFRLVFELPTPDTVLGLPIGQHVSIKTTIDGATVQRSYTPTSNNSDKGILELVIKAYPDGLLTGKHLAHLSLGDEVLFRGPKGAMRYKRGLCKKIGMLAGGTGITPMFQVIRAICEDDRDTTEVSLIFANRTEADILLREQLESYVRRYPKNLKVHYLVDQAPENWAYGTGHVTKELMAEKFPGPNEEGCKIMLCGPPGMTNAAKKALVELGYEKPSASSKMTDQVFLF
ncbi:NADH-cytochrome b5 reductase 1 [Cytospora mali]|uniref:NADH-cytochrome b5 reductase 1 n=1 Tax=Cytospora mali TaxID=578113 RepID=A0A194UND1_CYTMA|nr:NADH-cytochrome b5 reductase 1 [Valsa mali var. pyri (nom. inval.)]